VWAPLLGVTFEELPDDQLASGDVRILPRRDCPPVFGSWDGVPERDNEAMASATHAVALPHVSLMSWPDSPDALQPTEETQARLTDLVAMLDLESGSPVTYAELAMKLETGPQEARAVTYTFIEREYATRIDSATHHVATLTAAQLETALANWRQIPHRHPSVRTAAKRLLSSGQRGSFSHDSIVDLCVGIEALVGTGAGELVNRISMRTAAMLATVGWVPSADIAKVVRDIYGYRSQVVHGNPGPYKHALIDDGTGHPMHAERMATAVLINLLKIYFDHEDLTPELIDEQFIYAAFDSFLDVRESTAPDTGLS